MRRRRRGCSRAKHPESINPPARVPSLRHACGDCAEGFEATGAGVPWLWDLSRCLQSWPGVARGRHPIQADGGGSREAAPHGELGGATAGKAGHWGGLHPRDRAWGCGWPGHAIPWLWEHWGHAWHRGHKGVAGDAKAPLSVLPRV